MNIPCLNFEYLRCDVLRKTVHRKTNYYDNIILITITNHNFFVEIKCLINFKNPSEIIKSIIRLVQIFSTMDAKKLCTYNYINN